MNTKTPLGGISRHYKALNYYFEALSTNQLTFKRQWKAHFIDNQLTY